MHADTSRTGASFLSKQAPDNPRQMLIKILESNPEMEKDDLFKAFRDELKEDDNYQRAVDWYFFVNMYEYLNTSRNRKPDRASRAAAKAASDALVETFKIKLALLDLPMPNGKAMRDCTGAEMAKFGNRYQKIAEQVGKAKTVGSVLSEDQVKQILA
jgi:hypothetical protein